MVGLRPFQHWRVELLFLSPSARRHGQHRRGLLLLLYSSYSGRGEYSVVEKRRFYQHFQRHINVGAVMSCLGLHAESLPIAMRVDSSFSTWKQENWNSLCNSKESPQKSSNTRNLNASPALHVTPLTPIYCLWCRCLYWGPIHCNVQ